MARIVAEQVVVVTGASSGIGRAAALAFARRGARVVLAARNKQALDEVVAEIKRLGGEALAVPADVSDYAQMGMLANRAVDQFGRLDTWVNNAAVNAYGTVEQMDMAEIRRVIEVNLLGAIHGMKAALPHLRDGGTIVNVSSTLGKRAVPLQAAYCAASHGVVAFGEALRLELRHAGMPVEIVDVLPSSINTPLYEHARSMIGVRPMPTPPVYEPRVVADAIVAVAEKPVRQVFAGGAGRLTEAAQRFSPSLVDQYLLSLAFDDRKPGQPDDGRDNLFAPTEGPGQVTGQFGQRSKSISLYTHVFGLHPARGRVVAAALLLAAAAILRRAGRRR